MASYTHKAGGDALIQTLSSTTVDTVTVPAEKDSLHDLTHAVVVYNLNGSDPLYVTVDGSTPTSTNYSAKVTAGKGGRSPIQIATGNATVKILGNGNIYAVQRTDNATVGTTPSHPLRAQATYDAASLVDGAGATTTVDCKGAALGQFVDVAHSVNLAGITVTGWVSAADTVSVRFQNESGGTLDLASGTLEVRVSK